MTHLLYLIKWHSVNYCPDSPPNLLGMLDHISQRKLYTMRGTWNTPLHHYFPLNTHTPCLLPPFHLSCSSSPSFNIELVFFLANSYVYNDQLWSPPSPTCSGLSHNLSCICLPFLSSELFPLAFNYIASLPFNKMSYNTLSTHAYIIPSQVLPHFSLTSSTHSSQASEGCIWLSHSECLIFATTLQRSSISYMLIKTLDFF